MADLMDEFHAIQGAKPADLLSEFATLPAKYTGAPERAEEQRKLLESMGPGGRLLAGIGHGMHNTHLGISDLMGHIPGNEGARVDPRGWAQEEEVSRPLVQDLAGGVGELTGQTAMTLPIGAAAETAAASLGKALLPGASAAIAPLLGMGAGGAAQGASVAGPGNQLEGAKVGGGLGLGLGAGGRLLAAAAKGLAGPLEAMGIRAGRKVLTNGADQLSKRGPVREEAVKAALESKAIRQFGTSGGAFKRLQPLEEAAGQQYGDVLGGLQKGGAVGPNARGLADDLLAKAKDARLNNPGNPAIAREYEKQAERLIDASSEGEAAGIAPTGRLGLTQAESTKRGLQTLARYGRVEDTPLNEARQDIASTVRKANEDAIAAQTGPGSQMEDLGASFIPAKRSYGNLAEATDAARRGAAREAQRGHVGLGDLLWSLPVAGHGMATHNPLTALASLGAPFAAHALRARIPSTFARTAYGLGSTLGKLPISELTSGLSPAPLEAGLADKLLGSRLTLAPQMEPAIAKEDDWKTKMLAQAAALSGQ